ncbi:MAG TPA: hypothetical protein VEG32_08295 [Clostridia bacterium]|nr:hypothetical protein [Clostridia bacterium]
MKLATVLLAGLILTCGTPVAAQSVPAPSSDAGQQPSDAVPDAQTSLPATSPTGFQALKVSGPTMNRTFLSPSLRFSHRISGNTREADQGMQWESTSIVGGSLEFERRAGHNVTTLNYGAVGRPYTSGEASTNSMHQLSISQGVQLGRVGLYFANDFAYTSESNRFTGLEDIGDPSLEEPVLADDSIIVGHAPRFTNTTAGQMEYMLDRRKSLSFGGTYTLLRHRGEASTIDGNQIGGRAAFNYVVNRRTSIGVSYGLTRFGFQDAVQEIDSHTFHFSVSRQLSRTWLLNVAVGPELTKLGISESESSKSVRFSTSATLLYSTGRRTFQASYTEGTRNGSGVMVGSHSRRVEASLGASLSRNWSAEIRGAYANNSSFSELSSAVEQGRFHSGAAGIRIRRQLGSHVQAFTSYNLQRQDHAGGCATGIGCDDLVTRHAIEFGLRFILLPVRVR